MRAVIRPTGLIAAAFCLIAGAVEAADPAAPARDNIPRVWRALSGDRMELDGNTYRLSGVTCPAPDTDTGRQAKALLNTFLLGSRNSHRITCQIIGQGPGGAVDCRRQSQTARRLMINSGLCEASGTAETPSGARETLSLTRYQPAFIPVSIWRLRSCLGVHPDRIPIQCRLASRTWPLRYAEAARWLKRQSVLRCPARVGQARSALGPKATHAKPSRYSLRPFVPTHCHRGSIGH